MGMIKDYDGTLYGTYRMPTFSEVWDNQAQFVDDCQKSGLTIPLGTNELNDLYILLYARYGNSVIASSSVDRFCYGVYSIIYMYGGAWKQRKAIQDKVQSYALDDADIFKGSLAISNRANNPGTVPTTEELDAIDHQATMRYKKDPLSAYDYLASLIKTDVTKEFIDKFAKLFNVWASPEMPLLYEYDI